MSDITRVLSALNQGDGGAANQLVPLVYDELRKLAAARMAGESPDHTLQATALVHEAFLRITNGSGEQHWDSRGHFFAAAAEAMRQILVDVARRKNGIRRGGGRQRQDLLDGDLIVYPVSDELLDLDAALSRLGMTDPAAAELVKLRVFSAMTIDEVARYQGISPRTVKRNWAYARAWLAREVHRQRSF